MRSRHRRRPSMLGWAEPETTIRVTPAERRILRHLCRAGRTGAWVAIRARCGLLAAGGGGTAAIARAAGRGRAPRGVRQWRDRFARDRLNGLVDTPRSGRPARFSPRRTA